MVIMRYRNLLFSYFYLLDILHCFLIVLLIPIPECCVVDVADTALIFFVFTAQHFFYHVPCLFLTVARYSFHQKNHVVLL